MYGEEANTWYQIHTNGAVTTFARFYEGQSPEGDTIFYFEKMQTDNVNNLVEVFGIEEYENAADAAERLRVAIRLAE